MKYLSLFNKFESNISTSDSKLPTIERCRPLSEKDFLDILHKNCKNFSFSNDQLWRNKTRKSDLQLFMPNYRNAKSIAFPNFFNQIEGDDNYPVKRKMSLIGGTNKDSIKKLVGEDNYLVIPFDNSEIIFSYVIDIYAMADRKNGSIATKVETIGGRPIDSSDFVKVNYLKNFKIPIGDLRVAYNKSDKKYSFGDSTGFEFFTSSPCLLIHESRIAWLEENINNSIKESLSNYKENILDKYFGLTIEDIKEWFHDFMDEHEKSELAISMPEKDNQTFYIYIEDVVAVEKSITGEVTKERYPISDEFLNFIKERLSEYNLYLEPFTHSDIVDKNEVYYSPTKMYMGFKVIKKSPDMISESYTVEDIRDIFADRKECGSLTWGKLVNGSYCIDIYKPESGYDFTYSEEDAISKELSKRLGIHCYFSTGLDSCDDEMLCLEFDSEDDLKAALQWISDYAN